MSTLLVIDPSIKSAGVAVFQGGDLVAATTIKAARGDAKRQAVERCLRISIAVTNWITGTYRPDEFATEWPKFYRAGKVEGDPSVALPGLSGVGVGVAAILETGPALRPLDGALECFSYIPSDWCQGTSKTTKGGIKAYEASSRGYRILKRLSAAERTVWDAQVNTHDAGDAVGIGLHHLGRFSAFRPIAR